MILFYDDEPDEVINFFLYCTNFVPTDLPILVNQYFDVVRKYYPNARGGLLLDGKSYDVNKTWGQGEYKSYSPYISGITAGYISYF